MSWRSNVRRTARRVHVGHIQAARSKHKHCLNLLPRHIELTHDFVDRSPNLKILEDSRNRHPRIAKHSSAAQPPRHAFHRLILRPIQSSHGFALPSIVPQFLILEQDELPLQL
jgi:hypothetical protein